METVGIAARHAWCEEDEGCARGFLLFGCGKAAAGYLSARGAECYGWTVEAKTSNGPTPNFWIFWNLTAATRLCEGTCGGLEMVVAQPV